MTTNQTIDGVSRELVEWAYCLSCSMGYRADPRTAQMRALLDKEVSGDSRAPQTQGEPVAWLNVATGHVTTSAVVVMDWDDEKEQVQSLYAEQPAPVAVVLPPCATAQDFNDESMASGWNACLDEVTRLNVGNQSSMATKKNDR